MSNFCKKCGTQLTGQAKFCPKCGNAIQTGSQPMQTNPGFGTVCGGGGKPIKVNPQQTALGKLKQRS